MSFHYPINGGSGPGGGVTSLNTLTGALNLVAGNNIDVTASGTDITIDANFTQMGKYMISGGATWSGTGLTYDVSFLTYFFSGNKTANPTSVTLDPSDPTNSRLDAIVVDEAGVVSVITGTPSSSPVEPPIPADQLQVQFILVEAGSTAPTIATENIYLDDPTSGWTFSTYSTATPTTGSINFSGTNTPKQGINDIEASTDLRLGARFVRGTSFDAFQYTMFQVWVRFTGTAVASNKSLNVRFENSAGTLVGNTINLFNYGLQRNVLNTWQLVVVPITAFGALPATVKGLKVIMAGGTVGQVRQWDIDYMILTDGSVPFANVPTIAFYKNGTGIASKSGLNLIEGTGVTITAVNDPTNQRVNYTINASGGSPAGSDTQIQYNDGGSFGADAGFYKGDETFGLGLLQTQQSTVTFTGSGLDNLIKSGTFSGTYPTTYTVTIDGINKDYIQFPTNTISGSGFQVGETVTSSSGGSATIDAINLNSDNSYENLVLSSVTGTFLQFDVITGSTSSTTATIDSDLGQQDTYSWTDGTNSGSNVICKISGTNIQNGLSADFDTGSGHTLSDEWTWDYTNVQNNILDFSNGTYKFGTDFGTDYFGYEVGNNLFGFGLKGAVNTYTNVAGDQMITGYADPNKLGFIGFASINTYSSGEIANIFANKNGVGYSIQDSYGKNVIQSVSGVTTIGNISGGNDTKITIDDAVQLVTIGNTEFTYDISTNEYHLGKVGGDPDAGSFYQMHLETNTNLDFHISNGNADTIGTSYFFVRDNSGANTPTVQLGNNNGINASDTTNITYIGEVNGQGGITISNDTHQYIKQSFTSTYIDDKSLLQASLTSVPNSTATPIFEVSLPQDQAYDSMTGGVFTATTVAYDGTDYQSITEYISYSAVNKAGTYTTQITANTGTATATSSGTLTTTWTITTGTDKIIINCEPNSSLSGTSPLTYYNILHNSKGVITPL